MTCRACRACRANCRGDFEAVTARELGRVCRFWSRLPAIEAQREGTASLIFRQYNITRFRFIWAQFLKMCSFGMFWKLSHRFPFCTGVCGIMSLVSEYFAFQAPQLCETLKDM